MKYHDNEVTFSPYGSDVTLIGGSFKIEEFAITPGQDPKGKIQAQQIHYMGPDGNLHFEVGRSTDDPHTVANWWNARIRPEQTTSNHPPGDLNFAFIGTLTLTVEGRAPERTRDTLTFLGVALAQGHTGGANNWWFGGKHCSHSGQNQVICYGHDSKGGKVVFTFVRGNNGVSTVNLMPNELNDWMSGLGDGVRLDQIMMPGSHDAGMSETEHCDVLDLITVAGWVKTQRLSIGGQLVAGSRYFDIRVDYDHDELVTYHRSGDLGCNGQTLNAVLDETLAFLTENERETAILKISHIRQRRPDTTKRLISELLSKPEYAGAMYRNQDPHVNLASIPLGKVRGKMILVFDYDDNTYIDPSTGRFRYRDGVSEAQCRENIVSTAIRPDGNLTVYDCYSDTVIYEKMKKDQLKKWQACAEMGAGRFFLLSWTLTASIPVIEYPISTIAAEANERLPEVLRQQIVVSGWAKPNVVYIDFVNSKTCKSIIEHNF
jgi:hypothetical protein